jgi:hypothetical protein
VVFLFGAKSFNFVTKISMSIAFPLYILVACLFMVDYLGVFIFSLPINIMQYHVFSKNEVS